MMIKNIREMLQEQRMIGILWSVGDVLSIRPDLSDDDAWKVLQSVDKYASCDDGITWQTLEYYAEDMFPTE